MLKYLALLTLSCVLTVGYVNAQNNSDSTQSTIDNSSAQNEQKEKFDALQGKVDGIEEDYLATKSTVDKLSKIKISGYIQAQYRYADTSGQHDTSASAKPYTNRYSIGDFNGGALSQGTKSEFSIRRARFKVAYETPLTQMAIQLDCVPGSVGIKEADLRFVEPWLKSLALKAGVYDRPFGFEVMYSSSSLESPERSRLYQTLLPGEQDMGFSFEYLGSDKLPQAARFFNFKGGWFAGNGIQKDFQGLRDFIGRLGLSLPLTSINVALDAGVSTYIGKVINRSDSLYEVNNSTWTLKKVTKYSTNNRDYVGFDGQLYYGDIPFFGGISVRGEYVKGTQPSVQGDCKSQNAATAPATPFYMRDVEGYYGILVLNVDPIKCQLVGKYDVFDPNTELAEKQVTNKADMKVKTFGYGLIYHWSENVKLVAYYENVKNEKIAKVPYIKDVKDNVLTLRIQYKF